MYPVAEVGIAEVGTPNSKLAKGMRSCHPLLHSFMKIAIGSDHAGFDYKQEIIQFLRGGGHEVKDFGTNSTEPVDYPVYIRPVAEAVAAGEFERGIVLGGSGNGEAIVANRVWGIRCAVCWSLDSARMSRRHNDANVLSLGQRMIDLKTALEIVRVWLETPFEGGRHRHRIEMIDRP
jgi:ribose 5-phosphate isomerase B